MRTTTRYFFVGFAMVVVFVLIFFTASFLINVSSDQASTFYVPEVSGTLNFANPGSESFWALVPTKNVPLIASSNYPPSGMTPNAQVQIAWTNYGGTPQLLVKMKFVNAAGGSQFGTSTAYIASPLFPYVNDTAYPSGKVMPMYQNLSCTSQFSAAMAEFIPRTQDICHLRLEAVMYTQSKLSWCLELRPGQIQMFGLQFLTSPRWFRERRGLLILVQE